MDISKSAWQNIRNYNKKYIAQLIEDDRILRVPRRNFTASKKNHQKTQILISISLTLHLEMKNNISPKDYDIVIKSTKEEGKVIKNAIQKPQNPFTGTIVLVCFRIFICY